MACRCSREITLPCFCHRSFWNLQTQNKEKLFVSGPEKSTSHRCSLSSPRRSPFSRKKASSSFARFSALPQ